MVPTRVHERYGYPFFAMGVILAAVSFRWRIAYIVLTVATFANMYVVLTTIYPNNPSIADWLGIGPAIRDPGRRRVCRCSMAPRSSWAFVQLRSSAHRAWRDELLAARRDDADRGRRRVEDDTGREPGPTGAGPRGHDGRHRTTPAARRRAGRHRSPGRRPAGHCRDRRRSRPGRARPGFDQLGVIGWFRARLTEAPIRPDRSALLRAEGGGRLDRLDLWIVLVLIVGSMVLRGYRLAEPYQMHFDEVYHARTATEFLQAWRYGISHDIYEWTHPHLAKYAMAGGIVLWGQDDVSATSDLGVPVVAATVEPRRDRRRRRRAAAPVSGCTSRPGPRSGPTTSDPRADLDGRRARAPRPSRST